MSYSWGQNERTTIYRRDPNMLLQIHTVLCESAFHTVCPSGRVSFSGKVPGEKTLCNYSKPFALTACQGIAHKFIGSGTDRGYPIACLICFFISFWRCCPCFVRLSVFLSVHDINHETNIVMTCIHPDNTYSKLYSTKQERQAGIHVRQGQREESNSQHNYKTPNERVYDRQRIN